jgi:glutamate synthase domain-containing protein 2
VRKPIQFFNIVLALLIIGYALFTWPGYTLIGLFVIMVTVGIYDLIQKKHSVLRNFPIIGHVRYIFEDIAPEIHQYFIESGTDGKPINRNTRSYVYQRAKLENKMHPFGTQLDVNDEHYQWMQHSIYPAPVLTEAPREVIGGPDCKQPYSASLFNISAMSYGSLSKSAIMALNKGAQAGNFFHDTGEGGISPYHLQGGDLVYEVGTGYFGCRTEGGDFSPEKFKVQAARPEVKMIEIKISQGAKPGHGGVLPAAKNTEEIAAIRGVKPHTDVLSPPGHRAFSDAAGLLKFVEQLRQLSDGKPIGFKLCVGNKEEFAEICKKMIETGIKPAFITVDGAEGGTGAAPIIFSNYVGMPWEKGLIFVVDTLCIYGLKKHIKVFTATKIFTAFDIFKALCLGADVCSSARGMMLALGCIQALTCHTNTCPTGVATHNPNLVRGLVVEEKWKRVRNYQHETLHEFLEVFAAAGCTSADQLNRSLIYKNIGNKIVSYEDLYPTKGIGY